MVLAEIASDEWLRGQALALATAACASTLPPNLGAPNMGYAQMLLGDLLALPRGQSSDEWIELSEGIPPVALGRLGAIARRTKGWSWAAEKLESRYQFVSWDGKRSRIAAAKLVADRLLDSALPGSQIARLAAVEFGQRSKSRWRVDKTLHDALHVLRSGISRAKRLPDRVGALRAFRAKVSDPPPYWSDVEAAVMQRMFAWVPTAYDGSRQADAGQLLPIGIDVQFGHPDPGVELHGERSCDADFRACAVAARNAAIHLWKKSAPHLLGFAPQVDAIRVTFDLSMLSKIGGLCELSAERSRLRPSIVDRSAEAYLALCIFGRLIGSSRHEHAIATGCLGSKIENLGKWDTTPGSKT